MQLWNFLLPELSLICYWVGCFSYSNTHNVLCVSCKSKLSRLWTVLLQGAPAAKCTLDIESSLNYTDFWTHRNLIKMACPVSPFSSYVIYPNISDTWSSCSVGTTILVSSEQCPMGLWQPRQIDILKMRHWWTLAPLPPDSRLLMVSVHWGRHKCIFYFSSHLLGAKNCADSFLVKEDIFESLWGGDSLLD